MERQFVFPDRVVVGAAAGKEWPELERITISGEQLAVAFEEVQAKVMPAFREDSQLGRFAIAHRNEIVDFYNAVVADGRYLQELPTHPAEVARKLDLQVSDEAVYLIATVGSRLVRELEAGNIKRTGELSTHAGGPKAPPPKVDVIWGPVIIVGSMVGVAVGVAYVKATEPHPPDPPPAEQIIVMDESGILKIG